MWNILEDDSKRYIAILNSLTYKKKYISLVDLSIFLKESEETLSRDFDYFENFYGDFVCIDRDRSKIELLGSYSYEKIKYIQYSILNKSLNILLLRQIFIRPYQNVRLYAKLFEKSEEFIIISINHINSELIKYSMEIKVVNNKCFITAEVEEKLRKLMSVFWVEINLFALDENLFGYLKDQTELSLDENEILTPYYLSYVYVSSIREKNGFKINKDEKVLEYLFKEKLIKFLKKELFNTKNEELVIPLFNLLVKIFENETYYKIPIKLFISQLDFFNKSLKNKVYLYHELQSIITSLVNILGIDLFEYENLLNYILIVNYPDIVKFYASKRRVLYVNSEFSIYHANFLKQKLVTYFDNYYTFKIISTEELKCLNENELVITNQRHLPWKNKVLVDDYASSYDLKKIELDIVSHIHL